MMKNTTKTAAVAVGAMLVDDRFDPIEDARALASHKSPKIRKAIEAKGGALRFLPRYSPDFNPIEMMFSKLKTLLRKAFERHSGAVSANSSHTSRKRNAKTTSKPQDMNQLDRITL